MRLTRKFIAALVIGVALVALIHGYLNYERERTVFDRQMRGEAAALGRALARGVAHVWQRDGESAAREFLETATSKRESLLARWVWLDARGRRLPAPYFPGFDTLGTLRHVMSTGYDYSWFVLTQKIIEKEFALSGSEQNPDLTGKDVRQVLGRVRPGAPGPVEAFKRHGEDFVVATGLGELVRKMNSLVGEDLIEEESLRRTIVARDNELDNAFTKDAQVTALRGARNYRGDKLIRVASPHKILDPKAGPLIAVRLNILTRKTLGGLETDLSARVLTEGGETLPGVYAAGEVAGFGGGGMHGYNSLEGTFLGGCLFSGRTVGRAAAAAL